MLGYTESDLNEMIDSVHDAKLYYIRSASNLVDQNPLVEGLLKTSAFLQGLWAEGYFD
jgi:hypothetical protein